MNEILYILFINHFEDNIWIAKIIEYYYLFIFYYNIWIWLIIQLKNKMDGIPQVEEEKV